MKRKYFVPMGRIADFPHPAPERTACRAGRGIFDDYEHIVYSSREAMLKAVEMTEGGGILNPGRGRLVPVERWTKKSE